MLIGWILAIVGVVVVIKIYNNDDFLDGFVDAGKFIAAFAMIVAIIGGGLTGNLDWVLGVGVIIGGFFGIRKLIQVVDYQRSITPAPPPPPPEPVRSPWDYSD